MMRIFWFVAACIAVILGAVAAWAALTLATYGHWIGAMFEVACFLVFFLLAAIAYVNAVRGRMKQPPIT